MLLVNEFLLLPTFTQPSLVAGLSEEGFLNKEMEQYKLKKVKNFRLRNRSFYTYSYKSKQDLIVEKIL